MSFNIFDIAGSGMTAQRVKMDTVASNIANINTTRQADGSKGVYVKKDVSFRTIYEAEDGVKTVYDPSHPDADEEGYVDLPNINLVEEMVGMISASKAYEANATVAENVKTMMQSAMNI